MGGPAPKPRALTLMAGTHRPDRDAPNAPEFEVKAPRPPSWLHAEAKREWRRIVPLLLELGIIGEIHRAALVGYCEAYAQLWETSRILEREGMTFTTEKGYVGQHPAINIKNAALSHLRQYAAELGLTPARTHKVPGKPKNPKAGGDDAAAFFS